MMKSKLSILIIFCIITSVVLGQNKVKNYNIEDGVAIEGYDPVSYFIQKKPSEGKKEFSLKVDGILYYFSSETNKETFRVNPSKYQPQFGGWCAYAMGATNNKVDIDPETYKIISGKLYLYFNKWGNNTLLKWNKDEINLKLKAYQNWILINK